MRLSTSSFSDGQPLPGEFAFAVPDPEQHVTFAANRNPAFAWSEVPEGTRSFALLCLDRDAPSVRDDANQEDREVPADLARTDFSHWVLIDISADRRSIDVGEFSDGVTPRGKPGLSGSPCEGINDYTSWFEGDPDMEGTYKGYDGPCPPWNDSIVHHYDFTLYALDVETLGLQGDFTAAMAKDAMGPHILERASLATTYTLTPRLLQ